MEFLKGRAQVICDQLKDAVIVEKSPVKNWKMKRGKYITPADCDAANEKWEDFSAENDFWYGKDNHYWFRTFVTVPENFAGKEFWIHLETGIKDWDDGQNPQFLIFVNDVPLQGFDINHRQILLAEEAEAGQKLKIDLQSYSGTLHDELKLLCDLEVHESRVKDLYYDIQVPLWGLNRMEDRDPYKNKLDVIIDETVNRIDLRKLYSPEFYASIDDARAYIDSNLYDNPDMSGYSDVIATCIGHTHIDVAWLWTVDQTRQKACRSFATVLKLMEEYPSYKFMSSQPQLYEFVKERHPDLYQKIKDRIKEGRWEPEGGMWVEADCNLTSGESLVRQFLYGKKFFRQEFGVDNKELWLPDVFGYSGALPQIMKKSGIDYFMTTKLAWNEFDKVPMDTFYWEGIDGTRIFTHLITTLGVGQKTADFFTTYNGMLHPDSIMGGWERYQNKDINNDILISFGWGDGGGGPTRTMLETSKRMEKGIKGIPKVRQEFSKKYFDELYDRVKDSKRLPTWVGELYFEFHRGTYTSMGRNKRSNRKSEYRMMELELLSVLTKDKTAYPREMIDSFWKTILLNQFHDILPGSAIHEVYEVTKKEYEELEQKSGKLLEDRLTVLKNDITDSIHDTENTGISVVNTLGFERDEIIELNMSVLNGHEKYNALTDGEKIYPIQKNKDNAVVYVENIPSKGYKGLSYTDTKEIQDGIKVTGNTVENKFYRIVIDDLGQFTSIYDKEAEREVLIQGRVGNELRVYEDKPRQYDNWNIDIYYQEKSWPVADDVRLTWLENGPVRAALLVEKRMMDNTFSQIIYFYKDKRRVDFVNEVDWKMSQHLLKVHFPVDIHTDEATFDIQFGNLKRKIHENTSWDVARFETCGHKWADLSEDGYGIALMNDCKYGYSVLDHNLSLTLLKAGTQPNKNADIEMHYFTYSILPHIGDWKDGNVENESLSLNVPTHVIDQGEKGHDYSFVSVLNPNVVLETVKMAEDNSGIIVRVYEVNNRRCNCTLKLSSDVKAAELVNLIEEPSTEEGEAVISGNEVRFMIKPYEIKTIKLTL